MQVPSFQSDCVLIYASVEASLFPPLCTLEQRRSPSNQGSVGLEHTFVLLILVPILARRPKLARAGATQARGDNPKLICSRLEWLFDQLARSNQTEPIAHNKNQLQRQSANTRSTQAFVCEFPVFVNRELDLLAGSVCGLCVHARVITRIPPILPTIDENQSQGVADLPPLCARALSDSSSKSVKTTFRS
jgi:hypothetical protein